MMSFIYFCSMGFCLLIVWGLNRLSSFARRDRTIFNTDKTNNGQRTKASTFLEASSTTKLLQKTLLLVFFMLTGLFCWKVIVRNRVWRNRESLFRWILIMSFFMNTSVGINSIHSCFDFALKLQLTFIYRSGVETLPHNAKAHYNYANFLKDVGRSKEAVHHYETALRWVFFHECLITGGTLNWTSS